MHSHTGFIAKKCIALALCFSLAPLAAQAADIELLGIGLHMEESEQVQALEAQNYRCSQERTVFGIARQRCRLDQQQIRLDADRIRFSCEVFSACDLSSQAIAEKLTRDFISPEIITAFELEQEQLALVGNLSTIEKYCAYSASNQRLCIIENIQYTTGARRPEIELTHSSSD